MKRKRIKIVISTIAGSIIILLLINLFLQPQLYLEDKYVFGKSWGNLSTNNLQFSLPKGVAIDSKGNLYVADIGNNRIQKIQSDGNITSIGKNGSALGEFILPWDVAIDNKGNVYVADYGNNRIQKIQSDGNITSFGELGFDLGEFNGPSGVAIDSKGNLYVADTFNQRIQQFKFSQYLQFKFLLGI